MKCLNGLTALSRKIRSKATDQEDAARLGKDN